MAIKWLSLIRMNTDCANNVQGKLTKKLITRRLHYKITLNENIYHYLINSIYKYLNNCIIYVII